LLYLVSSFKRNLFLCIVVIVAISFFILSSHVFFVPSDWLNTYIHWGTYFFIGSLVYFLQAYIKISYLLFFIFVLCWYFLRDHPVLNTAAELLVICYGVLVAGYGIAPLKSVFFANNDYSYSLYIYAYPLQQTLIYICGSSNLSPLLLTILTLISITSFCLLSWNFIEKPCLKKKNIFLSN